MMGSLLELAKLKRPLVLWLLGLSVGSVGVITSAYLASASSQQLIAVNGLDAVTHPASMDELCEFLGQPRGPRCEQAREEEIGFAEGLLAESRRRYPLASAAQDPIGAAGIAAGMMASLLGAGLVGALAGSHTAGEWTNGTVKVILARDPRRVWFVVRKFLSTWIASVGLLFVTWLGLALLSVWFRSAYTVPPSPSGFRMAEFAASNVTRSLLVLAVFSAIGTCAGIITRNPLGTFGLTLGVVFLSFALTTAASTFQASPAYWVSGWMGFSPDTLWADHLWVDRFPLSDPDPSVHLSRATAALGLAGTILVSLLIGGTRMARSDVGG